MISNYRFHHGQTVWVRNLGEILKTLDEDSKLNGLPFMPEMIRYCGHSFRVSRLASKTCVEGCGIRHMKGTVFLEDLRCDGSSHDGCERGCLLFWKEAWLSDQPPTQSLDLSVESAVVADAQLKTRQGDRYYCQSTRLATATSKLPGGKLMQYLGDIWLREISISQFMRLAMNTVVNRIAHLTGLKIGQQVRGHLIKTDTVALNLKPGELVEIKSREEIESTLNVEGKNRGLLFERGMLDYCGKRYRVAGQLKKIILEETGQMISLKNTVILEGVTCQTTCPRANLLYWREIWLKRVAPTIDNEEKPPTLETFIKHKTSDISQDNNKS